MPAPLVLKVPTLDSREPAVIVTVRLPELRLAMLLFDVARLIGTSLIAFAGWLASSSSSTQTLPESALGRNSEGDTSTLNFEGNPLGVTVFSCEGTGEERP